MQEVSGELYEVDWKLLENLDWHVSHREAYSRIATQCIMLDTKTTMECEACMVSNFKPELLSLPHLSSYSDTGYKQTDEMGEDYSFANEIKANNCG